MPGPGSRLISPLPDDPSVGIFADENGDTYTAPIGGQTGFAEDASALLTAPVPQEQPDLMAWNGGADPLYGNQPVTQLPDGMTPDQAMSDAVPARPAPPPTEETSLLSAGRQQATLDGPSIQHYDPLEGQYAERRAMARGLFGSDRVPIEPEAIPHGHRATPGLNGQISGNIVPVERQADVQRGIENFVSANDRVAEVQQGGAEAAANVLDDSAAREQEEYARIYEMHVKEAEQRATQITGELHSLFQQVRNDTVDPDRFFAQRGDSARFGAAIALAAGAMAQALLPGTQNTAAAIIEGAIERDIQAQMATMQNRQGALQNGTNMLSQMQSIWNDQGAAIMSTRALRLHMAATRLEAIARRTQGAEARARTEALAAQLRLNYQEAMLQAQTVGYRAGVAGSPLGIAAQGSVNANSFATDPAIRPEAQDLRATEQGQPARDVLGTGPKPTATGAAELPAEAAAERAELRQQQVAETVQQRERARARAARPREQAPAAESGSAPVHIQNPRVDLRVGAYWQAYPRDDGRLDIRARDGGSSFVAGSLEEAVGVLQSTRPATEVYNPGNGLLQIQRPDQGIAPHQGSDTADSRRDIVQEFNVSGQRYVLRTEDRERYNEVSGEARSAARKRIQAATRLASLGREFIQDLGQLRNVDPSSEQYGRLLARYRQLIPLMAGAYGSGVLNEGEREYFASSDARPDLTGTFSNFLGSSRARGEWRGMIESALETAEDSASEIGMRIDSAGHTALRMEHTGTPLGEIEDTSNDGMLEAVTQGGGVGQVLRGR